jgi:membrane-bound lytic murein transglycosylase D
VITTAENIATASTTPTPLTIPITTNPAVNTPISTLVYQPSPTTVPAVSKPFTPAPSSTKPNYKIIHTIQAGETIYRVSKIYNATVDNIKQWNNLGTNTVEIGQELVIMGDNTKPTVSVYPEPTPTKMNSSPSNNSKYHTLQAGETVFRLSKLYGVTIDEIVKWNNIKNFAVIVGQRLVVKK